MATEPPPRTSPHTGVPRTTLEAHSRSPSGTMWTTSFDASISASTSLARSLTLLQGRLPTKALLWILLSPYLIRASASLRLAPSSLTSYTTSTLATARHLSTNPLKAEELLRLLASLNA